MLSDIIESEDGIFPDHSESKSMTSVSNREDILEVLSKLISVYIVLRSNDDVEEVVSTRTKSEQLLASLRLVTCNREVGVGAIGLGHN